MTILQLYAALHFYAGRLYVNEHGLVWIGNHIYWARERTAASLE
jgi:hypothetical protein